MLQNRLRLIASLVDRGSVVADIGTDHAHLPVYLVKENIIPRAVACDIRPKPLEKGRLYIQANHLEDKISTVLSDGLQELPPETADTFIMAGMGADVLIHILSECEYIRDPRYTLILQPMSRYYELIRYLYKSGFSIITQVCTHEGERLYTVIKARYSGSIRLFGEADIYLGKLELNNEDSRKFLIKEIQKAERRAIGDPALNSVIELLKGKLYESN